MLCPVDNPFSAQAIAPGVAPYALPESLNWDQILHRWTAARFQAAIVGPHGSGKTTFLLSFLEQRPNTSLKLVQPAQEWRIVQYQHPRQLWLLQPRWVGTGTQPRGLQRDQRLKLADVFRWLKQRTPVAFDGFDGLSNWQQYRLLRTAHRHQTALLITSHAPTRLPTLLNTTKNEAWFQQWVDSRLTDNSPSALQQERIREAWQRHPGDVREAQFELYDVWEKLSRMEQAPGLTTASQ